MAEKVDEFVRSENVLDTMDKRTLKKQRSRLQSRASELEAPKLKYAPPPPPLPPPPTLVVSKLPIKAKRDGEPAMVERPQWGDWTEQIKQKRITLRKDRRNRMIAGVICNFYCRKLASHDKREGKKKVQEMNEGELLTALRKKLKNIEAAGESRNSLTVHRILPTIKNFVFFSRIF